MDNTQQQKQKRAVIYTRVSTDEQADAGTSLRDQDSVCLAKSMDIGAVVVKKIVDSGVSGSRYLTRDGIQEALDIIEAGGADVVIATNMSRCSRDAEHQAAIRRRIRNAGAQLILVDLSIDDSTPAGTLAVGIMGQFAEFERATITERTTRGRRRRALEGKQPARSMAPFGYKIVGKRDVLIGTHKEAQLGDYEIIEDQARWVREIFTRYAAGASLRSISSWATAAGVPNVRGGKMWYDSGIKRLFENPVYRGEATYGRFRRIYDEGRLAQGWRDISYLRERPEADWIYIDAPAIVSEELWRRCNDRLHTARKQFGGNPKRKHMLTGLLQCPVCERGMTGTRRERDGHKEHDYACRDSRPSRNAAKIVCCAKHYRAERVERLTLDAVRYLAADPDAVSAALASYRRDTKARRDPKEGDRLRAGLRALEAKERATVQAQVAGIQAGADPSAYASLLGEIARDRAGLQRRLMEIEILHQALTPDPIVSPATLLSDAAADLLEVLESETLTDSEKHDLLSHVIESITPFDNDAGGGENGFVLRMKPFWADQSVPNISRL